MDETKYIPKPTAAGGMRKRFRELMDPVHFDFPRKTGITHKAEWYLGDGPLARPVYGIYGLARYAEYLLHHVRFGKRKQHKAIREVAGFFAATRRALQNTLSTYPIDRRLSPRAAVSLRKVVADLIKQAAEATEAIRSCKSKPDANAAFDRLVKRCERKLERSIKPRRPRNRVISDTRKDI